MSRERTRPTEKRRDLDRQTVLRASLYHMRTLLLEWDDFNQDAMFFLRLSFVALNRYSKVPRRTLAHRYNSAQAQRKPD